MGNYCKCPEGKGSSKKEVIVDIYHSPLFSTNNHITEFNDKALSPVIKIQKFYRVYLSKKRNSISKPSTGETQCSMILLNTTSINADLINELYNNYPSISDNSELIHVDASFKGEGIYSGEINEISKERTGRGIQVWLDKSTYLGYWKNNKANGKGKLIYPQGDYYEGDFVDGKIEGFGHYVNKLTCISYIGDWKNDLQDGYGTEKWNNQTEYQGQYREGKKWGKGSIQFKDGSRYIGEFYSDQLHGKGRFIWNNGSEYEGNWRYNKMEGYGVYKGKDGKQYIGHYVNDRKEGEGEFTWPDGKRYKGKWKRGKQHGEGAIYEPSLREWKKGEWYEGRRVKWKE